MICDGPDDLEESTHILEFFIEGITISCNFNVPNLKLNIDLCTLNNDTISERMAAAKFHNENFVIISSNVKISMPHWRRYLEQNWDQVKELF